MSSLSFNFKWCEQVCRASGSSFFVSFRLLEHERRQAIHSLYAFSRISDDLSDSPDDPNDARERLELWREQVSMLAQERDPRSVSRAAWLASYAPLWPALMDSIRRFDIPVRLLEDIVEGVSRDLNQQRFRNWKDLDDYCYHVASAVGLACVHIWKASPEIPRQQAIDCGIAFQLTNILRDVAEDARMGRVYLPEELLAAHRIERRALLALEPHGSFGDLVREVSERAEKLYRVGWQVKEYLTPDSQRMFSLMWRSYHRLLQEVTTHRDELLTGRRIALPRLVKLQLATTHFVAPFYRHLTTP